MRSSVHRVRQTVAALRAALLAPASESSPEAIASHAPVLQEAAMLLERCKSGQPDGACRGELEALSSELRIAAKLLTQGLALTQGMARLLTPATGYRQDGEPAQFQAAGSVLIRG